MTTAIVFIFSVLFVIFTVSADKSPIQPPAVTIDHVWLTSGPQLIALRSDTGDQDIAQTVSGSVTLGAPLAGSSSDGTPIIYVPSLDGSQVFCLNASDARNPPLPLLWHQTLLPTYGKTITGLQPFANGDLLVTAQPQGRAIRLRLSDGTQLWNTPLISSGDSYLMLSVTVGNVTTGTEVVVYSYADAVGALDANNGTKIWSQSSKSGRNFAEITSGDGVLFVISRGSDDMTNPELSAYTITTGALEWSYTPPMIDDLVYPTASVGATPAIVYVFAKSTGKDMTQTATLVTIDAVSGTELWTVGLDVFGGSNGNSAYDLYVYALALSSTDLGSGDLIAIIEQQLSYAIGRIHSDYAVDGNNTYTQADVLWSTAIQSLGTHDTISPLAVTPDNGQVLWVDSQKSIPAANNSLSDNIFVFSFDAQAGNPQWVKLVSTSYYCDTLQFPATGSCPSASSSTSCSGHGQCLSCAITGQPTYYGCFCHTNYAGIDCSKKANSHKSHSKSSTNHGKTVGIVLGVILGVAAIGAVAGGIAYWRLKKKQSAERQSLIGNTL